MSIFILYRPNSEHDLQVQSYAREFKRVTGSDLELVSLDTKDGAYKAEIYDVIRYPAVVAAQANGTPLHIWQDEMLPTISEVSGYLRP